MNDLPMHLRAFQGLGRGVGRITGAAVRRLRPMGEVQLFLRSCGVDIQRLDHRGSQAR